MYITVIFKTKGAFVMTETVKTYEFKLEGDIKAPCAGDIITMFTNTNTGGTYEKVCHGAHVMVIDVHDRPEWPEHTKEVIWKI